jgi:hypothetical protein
MLRYHGRSFDDWLNIFQDKIHKNRSRHEIGELPDPSFPSPPSDTWNYHSQETKFIKPYKKSNKEIHITKAEKMESIQIQTENIDHQFKEIALNQIESPSVSDIVVENVSLEYAENEHSLLGIDKSESNQPNIIGHFIQSQSQLNPISNEILEQTRKSFRGKDMINGIVS